MFKVRLSNILKEDTDSSSLKNIIDDNELAPNNIISYSVEESFIYHFYKDNHYITSFDLVKNKEFQTNPQKLPIINKYVDDFFMNIHKIQISFENQKQEKEKEFAQKISSYTYDKKIVINPNLIIGDMKIRNSEELKNKIFNSLDILINYNNDDKISTEFSIGDLSKAIKFAKINNVCSDVKHLIDNCFMNKATDTIEKNNVIKNIISKIIKDNKIDNSLYQNTISTPSELSVYPVELIDPIVIAGNSEQINWQGASHSEFLKHFGNNLNLSSCEFYFPTNSSTLLMDSALYVTLQNGSRKILKISTKGGLNGKGASASLKGISQYLLKEEDWKFPEGEPALFKKYTNRNINDLIPDIQNICSNLKSMESYSDISDSEINLAGIILLFGLLSPNQHKNVIDYMNNNKNSYLDYLFQTDKKFKSLSEIARFLNKKTKISDFIMKILGNSKYDFIQINNKPNDNQNTFSLQFTAQYPALFTGTAKIEVAGSGINKYLKFHIV